MSRKSFIHIGSDSQSTPTRSSTGSAWNHVKTRDLSLLHAPASSDCDKAGGVAASGYQELDAGEEEDAGNGGGWRTLALGLFFGIFRLFSSKE